jgi:penicillin-binding protein 2
MAGVGIPRRVFLQGLGVAFLLSGCSPDLIAVMTGPTATPLPTPTPTPLPSADAVLQAYFSAWSQGNYEAMYGLLTPQSQQRLTQPQFQNYYLSAQTEATVTQVQTQLQSLLHTGNEATATFRSTWQTHLFGPLKADNQIRLQFEQSRWGVLWQPTLVLPQLGEGVSLVFLSDQPTRGNIYDRNFHALATQGQMVTVGIIPQYLEDRQAVVNYLATLTKVPPEKIIAQIDAARPDWFVPIAEVTFETSLQYDNLLNNLAGVDRRAHEVRTYSDGDTASHIIGYMGKIPAERKQEYAVLGYRGDEMVGLSGVEGWAEAELAGQRGGRLVTLSSSRQVLAEMATLTSRAGSSIYLTIDTLFQATIERLLGERLGAIVVMDPYSAAIYALASYPRFQPAIFTAGFEVDAWAKLYTNDQNPLLNRTTQGLYPPASVFKIVTMSAALEAGGFKPEDSFVCTGKWDKLGKGFEKKCWLEGGHGEINLVDGLTQSCDVVFYEVGLALHKNNPQVLPNWAKSFGLGAPTNIIGLTEGSGVIPDPEWKQTQLNQPLFDGDAVNTAIGQGYTLCTPLQIARMVAAIGNGGSLLRPRLLDRIVGADGATRVFEPETAGMLALSPEHLDLIRFSLEAVVSGARGTARNAFTNVTYTVAGKTGTAESGQEKPHAWFAGYAPATNPRVVITVILEHAGEGSKEAAPLFRQVAEAFFEWEASQGNLDASGNTAQEP